MAELSPEQATATLPEKTVWVGASAGTGKTHVLTARVLRLMVRGTPPGSIICLTFTKAAAAEMKNRIFKELGQWAVMEDIKLMETLQERVGERGEKDIMARARRLFADVLDLPGGLQIMTFHSFCQSLLGRFPLEAGLAPGFEALDDQLSATIKLEARDSVLKSFQGQSALKTVAQRVSEDDFDRVMNSLMYKGVDVKALLKKFGRLGMRAAMMRHFDLPSETTSASLITAATSDSAFSIINMRHLYRIFESGAVSEKKLAVPMHDFILAEEPDRPAFFSAYMEAFLTKDFAPRKNLPTKATAKKAPDAIDIFADEQQRLYTIKQQLLTVEMIDATCALLTLGFEQISAYENLKHSRGLVDFDDMINSTVNLLVSDAAAPWILYKMDGGIDHILVDEAQDTNSAQWQVVEALSEDFFSGLGARAGEDQGQSDTDITPRTLFAVGDVKQSIYSFQKADPKEFVAARKRVFTRAEGAAADFEAVPLNTSYRSGGAVLGLVDQVFKKGGPAYAGISFDEEEIIHHFARVGQAGSVELWPLVTEEAPDDADNAEEDVWQAPVHQEEKRDAERLTAQKIANHIHQLITDKVMLQSKGRPITAGDILVIVRKRSAFVEHLTRALKALDVAVSGRDRIKLTEEQPVMDLLSLMRFVLQPGDDLSCAEILTGPFVGMHQEDLFTLAHARGDKSLWQVITDQRDTSSVIANAYRFLSDCLNSADRGTPFDFLMTVLSDFDGRRRLMHRLGAEINDALDELLEQALDFERRNSPSLQNFLHGFELSDVTIKRDMEEAGSAVRIMTAHGSKGLQAPIVYLPDTTSVPEVGRDTSLMSEPSQSEGRLSSPLNWIYWTSGIKNLAHLDALKDAHKETMLAEQRRLLYVAMTRAEDHLYMVGWEKKRKVSDECWYNLIRSGFESLDGAQSVVGVDGETLSFGVDQTAHVEKPKLSENTKSDEPLPDYFSAPAPSEPTPSRPLTPSRPDSEDPAGRSPLSRASDKPFQRGNLIHSMLEWLPQLPDDEREQAARAFLAKPGHKISDIQQQTLLSEVMAVLNHSDAHILFSPTSRAEVPIAGLLPDGTAISAQVDRLVISADRLWIVDYKTNQPPPDSADRIPPIYKRQMRLYASALKAIYPDLTVVCYLLWTDSLDLMEVPLTE